MISSVVGSFFILEPALLPVFFLLFEATDETLLLNNLIGLLHHFRGEF